MNSEKVTKKQIDLMLRHARERGNQQEVKRLKKIWNMNKADYQVRHFVPSAINRR